MILWYDIATVGWGGPRQGQVQGRGLLAGQLKMVSLKSQRARSYHTFSQLCASEGVVALEKCSSCLLPNERKPLAQEGLVS